MTDSIPPYIKKPHTIKSYVHFDFRTSFAAKANLVMDPGFVKSYAFYPLIQRDLRRMKPDGHGKFFNDPRPIKYAAHLDRCIYQYYSGLLNERYNDVATEIGIGDCAIAYRAHLKGQSNCDFALRAFSKMRDLEACFAYAGDFEDFFETLDHAYLKKQVRRLFPGGAIPDDYYHVLKNATRHSVWDIEKLLDQYGLPYTKSGVKRLNNRGRVLSSDEFKNMVGASVERPWRENGEKGVPQGLPISGTLANIYMLEFDAAVKAVAERHDGLYMRYSDDFIFVVPTEEGFEEGRDEFSRLAGTMPSLKIHPRKTHSFRMVDGGVYLLDSEDEPKCAIDYLGFSFDGTSVRLRQRTIGRFYKRMYRRVGRLYKWKFRPAKKRVDSLYLEYSDWGRKPKRNAKVRERVGKSGGRGNFLTYAERAQNAFPNDPILVDVKNHKRKIRRRAKKVRESGRRHRSALRST
ncbi:reverse transcriptase domain-containing protein [Gordonibacter pamelaeae]|uniref:reverse transcriptase domain-containing protein n=1 Tax=Gordonibacter pamelaeae TaxID=471189 RepID=UPI00266FBB04|nr:reverse transcriptase domain-containing protein [Gordonibacter pamelaeae]